MVEAVGDMALGLQQKLDEDAALRRVVDSEKFLGLLERRNPANDIEIDPPHELGIGGRWVGWDVQFLQPCFDQLVNLLAGVGGCCLSTDAEPEAGNDERERTEGEGGCSVHEKTERNIGEIQDQVKCILLVGPAVEFLFSRVFSAVKGLFASDLILAGQRRTQREIGVMAFFS